LETGSSDGQPLPIKSLLDILAICPSQEVTGFFRLRLECAQIRVGSNPAAECPKI
jgi:hypothetical protein